MARMRVLHVHNNGICVGGIETFIAAMTRATESECDSQLFSLWSNRVYEHPELPITDEQPCRQGATRKLAHLWRHIRDWRPDILHAHFTDAYYYAAVARALTPKKPRLVLHWHTTSATPSGAPIIAGLVRYAVGSADAVLACSKAAADAHSAHQPVGGKCVRVLYNPISPASFAAAAANTEFRGQMGVGDGLLAVFLGRLSVQVKGLDIICEAVRLLPAGLPLGIALVGPGDVVALREQLDLPDAIVLAGAVDRTEVPGILRAADICLQPSRSEGFPLSIVEAMAAGLPVIATRVGGIPEAVEDGVTGVLVPPEDPQALAEAIQWMVEHPAERAEMGRRGRERARLFDVHTIAEQLVTIYREVLDG